MLESESLQPYLNKLNKQDDLYRPTWSILQAISNDEEQSLINQLKEDGKITDVGELVQILDMTEFALIFGQTS